MLKLLCMIMIPTMDLLLHQNHKNELIKKESGIRVPDSFRSSKDFDQRLLNSNYLFGDRQALPKTPEKTEMVLRFPLGFA